MLAVSLLKPRLSFIKIRKFASDAGEDYLKVHKPAMYWFPSRKPSLENDAREIGPYPQFPHASANPAGSFQLRPAESATYFDRQNRRKFGEPVPEEAEFQGMWNVDIEGDYSVVYMLTGMVLLLGGVGTIAYFSTKYHDPFKSPRLLAVILTEKSFTIVLSLPFCRWKRNCLFKKITLKDLINRFIFGQESILYK